MTDHGRLLSDETLSPCLPSALSRRASSGSAPRGACIISFGCFETFSESYCSSQLAFACLFLGAYDIDPSHIIIRRTHAHAPISHPPSEHIAGSYSLVARSLNQSTRTSQDARHYTAASVSAAHLRASRHGCGHFCVVHVARSPSPRERSDISTVGSPMKALGSWERVSGFLPR